MVVPEYKSCTVTKSIHPKALRIGKTLSSYFVQRGCQCCFVAKKPYLDHFLKLLIYKNAWHLNDPKNIDVAPWSMDIDIYMVLGYRRQWN